MLVRSCPYIDRDDFDDFFFLGGSLLTTKTGAATRLRHDDFHDRTNTIYYNIKNNTMSGTISNVGLRRVRDSWADAQSTYVYILYYIVYMAHAFRQR